MVTEGVESGGADLSAVEAYQRDNIFLGGQLVSSGVWSGSGWTTLNYQFYAVDHLGSTRLVTDVTAASVQGLKYWPYGDDAPGSGSDAGQRLKFAGMERDTENKHYFDHARTADFNLGRFVSADLVFGSQETPQSWNRYSYVMNRPTTLLDPTGRAATFCYLVPGNKGDGYQEECVELDFGPSASGGNGHGDGGNGHFGPGALPGPTEPSICSVPASSDPATEARIEGLDPRIQQAARDLVGTAQELGLNLRITDGFRSFGAQDALYAQGRTVPGRTVTNARGGGSFHNYGLAFDVVPMEGGAPAWNAGANTWTTVGSIGMSLGFEWGGNWRSPVDNPHFQMSFGQTTQQLECQHAQAQ